MGEKQRNEKTRKKGEQKGKEGPKRYLTSPRRLKERDLIERNVTRNLEAIEPHKKSDFEQPEKRKMKKHKEKEEKQKKNEEK